jgi:hypothetical protein
MAQGCMKMNNRLLSIPVNRSTAQRFTSFVNITPYWSWWHYRFFWPGNDLGLTQAAKYLEPCASDIFLLHNLFQSFEKVVSMVKAYHQYAAD